MAAELLVVQSRPATGGNSGVDACDMSAAAVNVNTKHEHMFKGTPSHSAELERRLQKQPLEHDVQIDTKISTLHLNQFSYQKINTDTRLH